MSDVMYVLVESGGSYEDAWKANIAASTDPEKLKHHQWELEERRKRQIEAQQDISDAFNEYSQRVKRPDWPRPVAALNFTKAQRKAMGPAAVEKARQAHIAQVQAEQARWAGEMDVWFGALYQGYVDIMTKHDLVEDIVPQQQGTTWWSAVQGTRLEETYFEIEEVPLI